MQSVLNIVNSDSPFNIISQRKIGVPICLTLVMGNMIGSGIFLLPATLAPLGTDSIKGWLISALGALLLAVVLARLSRTTTSSGGPYLYCRDAMGNLAGFICAWCYWVSLVVGNAAVAIAFAGYLHGLLPFLQQSRYSFVLTGLLTIWLLTIVNCRGSYQSGQLLLVATVLKVIPLLVLGIFGWLFLESGAQPVQTAELTPSSIGFVAALTFWAFIGLESATVPAAIVNQPQRTIPIVTVLGVVFTAIIYILVCAVAIRALPTLTLAESKAPLSLVASSLWGRNGELFLGFGGLVATFGALNGFILISGHLGATVARHRLFPDFMRRQNDKNATPQGALYTAAIFSSLFIALPLFQDLVDEFEFLVLLATTAMVIPYGLCALCEIFLLRKRAKTGLVKYLIPLAISSLVISYLSWTVFATRQWLAPWIAVLILIGLIYFWFNQKRRQ